MRETQENWVIFQNGQNPHHLQLKIKKKDVRSSGLGLQRGGRKFTGRWESKCLVNECLLCQAEKMGYRVDSDL